MVQEEFQINMLRVINLYFKLVLNTNFIHFYLIGVIDYIYLIKEANDYSNLNESKFYCNDFLTKLNFLKEKSVNCAFNSYDKSLTLNETRFFLNLGINISNLSLFYSLKHLNTVFHSYYKKNNENNYLDSLVCFRINQNFCNFGLIQFFFISDNKVFALIKQFVSQLEFDLINSEIYLEHLKKFYFPYKNLNFKYIIIESTQIMQKCFLLHYINILNNSLSLYYILPFINENEHD